MTSQQAQPIPSFSLVRKARVAISTVFLINGAGIGLWAAHIPVIQARLALPTEALGLVLLTVAAGAMLAMPLAGLACARMGSKHATCLFGVLFALATAGLVAAPGIAALFVLAFLFGAANGLLDVAMNANAADVERARGRPTMSSFHGFFSVGGLSGALLGGLMIRAGLGEGGGALLLAGVSLAAILLLQRSLLDSGAHQREGRRSRSFIAPRGRVLALGLLALLCMVVEGALVDWSALLLRERSGVGAPAAAIGYSAFSITMALSRFAGDRVVARLGPAVVMAAGGIAISCGIALAVATPYFVVGCIGFALVGLGAANVVPVVFSAAAGHGGERPEAALAAVATIGYSGFLMGPPAIGWIAAHSGLAVAVGTLALAGAVIAASAGVARPDGAGKDAAAARRSREAA